MGYQDNESGLTEDQIREVEESMEKRIHRNCIIGDIIELFVLVLIVLAIFFQIH